MINDHISKLITSTDDPFTDLQIRNVRFLLAFYAVRCADDEEYLTEAVRIVLKCKEFVRKRKEEREENQ